MKRSIVAALVAVFLAAVGCAAVWLYVSGADKRALAGKQPVEVLITTKRVPAGTTGKQVRDGGFVETVRMPVTAVPKDALP